MNMWVTTKKGFNFFKGPYSCKEKRNFSVANWAAFLALDRKRMDNFPQFPATLQGACTLHNILPNLPGNSHSFKMSSQIFHWTDSHFKNSTVLERHTRYFTEKFLNLALTSYQIILWKHNCHLQALFKCLFCLVFSIQYNAFNCRQHKLNLISCLNHTWPHAHCYVCKCSWVKCLLNKQFWWPVAAPAS